MAKRLSKKKQKTLRGGKHKARGKGKGLDKDGSSSDSSHSGDDGGVPEPKAL